jgi:excisionase family DNA binding protein
MSADHTTYTISQAAALTGLHKNTIRMKVKAGQIPAEARPGKFGVEYRISRRALIEVGLLDEESAAEPPEEGEVLLPVEANLAEDSSLRVALRDLFLHHENAMFRMGYMEAELERTKALAANAESLQEERLTRDQEIRDLKRELEAAQARAREIDELRAMLTEMERETERLRSEVEAFRAAEERRRRWQFWRRSD